MPRFVQFIQPQAPSERGAASQRLFECVRECVPDVDLVRFSYAGSMEKGTGLRRYRTTDCVVPGQSVDLVLAVGDLPVAAIASTHARLENCGPRCFAEEPAMKPDDYRRMRLRLRVAPVLEVCGLGQFLIREDRTLEPLQLSYQHEEVRKRTRDSNRHNPQVPFNDLVRLLKWWRHVRPPDGCAPPSSIEVERLAMLAYDARGVPGDWLPTLADWCEWLSGQDELEPALASWLAGGAVTFARADALERHGEHEEMIELLERETFGSAFRRGVLG